MASKDEYEVARLMTADHFQQDLQAQFEGDVKLTYHLAPPLLAHRKDARGRPVKRGFGPWLRPVLSLLARAKPLRGTALNPFGYHSEARLHRETLAWYLALLDRMQQDCTATNEADWQSVLTLTGEIRGYGPVRAEAAGRIRAEIASRLDRG